MLPILHPGGAATALLALILCAYLMSSSDDILPLLALLTELSFCFAWNTAVAYNNQCSHVTPRQNLQVVTLVFYITKPHSVNAVVGDPLNLDDNFCYGAKNGSDHTKFSFSIVWTGWRLGMLLIMATVSSYARLYRLTIRYDTRSYINVCSKANMSQLNLPHATDN